MADTSSNVPKNFATLAFTDTVKAVQTANGSRASYANVEASGDRYALTWRERAFIQARDSFYMASVGANGWPYVQFRGGPRGFLRVIDESTLAFADFRGNRQYISTGNVLDNRRVALILMDYPNRGRLKVWADAEIVAPDQAPDLASRAALADYDAVVERIFRLDVQGFDWNCPQHIVPRYTLEEIRAAAAAGSLELA